MTTRIADQFSEIAARAREIAESEKRAADQVCFLCCDDGWINGKSGSGPPIGWIVCTDCGNPMSKPSPFQSRENRA